MAPFCSLGRMASLLDSSAATSFLSSSMRRSDHHLKNLVEQLEVAKKVCTQSAYTGWPERGAIRSKRSPQLHERLPKQELLVLG